MAKNEVRIIGGKWRGRKLRFPNVSGLRPTMDRSRETLFNWLQGYLPGAHCLDLFAGAGALGFEASSRGAACVDMVDNNARVIQSLQAAHQQLAATNIEIFRRDGLRFLASAQKRYEIVFLDPPFASDLATQALTHLYTEQGRLLTANALVYVEIARRGGDVWRTDQWLVQRDKAMGERRCILLTPAGSNQASPPA